MFTYLLKESSDYFSIIQTLISECFCVEILFADFRAVLTVLLFQKLMYIHVATAFVGLLYLFVFFYFFFSIFAINIELPWRK